MAPFLRACSVVTLALILSGLSLPASAHPGGLNSQGCHTNRKTGEYHCHRASGAPKATPASPSAKGNRAQGFRSCKEARAAGYSRIRRGEPGYAPHLDRDQDGIACE